jgi:hypothetical protein
MRSINSFLRFSFIAGVFILFIASEGLQGQNTKRAFKLLEKADYLKSKEVFQESLKENPDNPAALLGLMLVMADDSSVAFDLVKAWENAIKLKANIEKLTPDELEYIGEYFYNTEKRHISRPVKKKIEYAIETVEAKLIKYIREENNLELVYKVLDQFPDFRYYDNVIHIRNQLEFRKVEKQNALEGYLEFIKKFPEAAQVEKAVRYRNQIAFDNACKINTPEAFEKYISDYPESEQINPAIKKLHSVSFEQAKKENTIQAMEKFIKAFPDALEVSDAGVILKQLLYEYAKKIKTLDAYNEFIRKYPDGQQYIDIFNLKSLDNGTRFITAHPLPGNQILWSRSYEEEENDELNACIAIDSMNNYIVGGTVFRSDTGNTDAWIIKVNPDGKMLWNKYVGESYNDEINYIAVNKENEIFGAGYTWLGLDSASRESWVFKMGPDGKKLWSRKLGHMHINQFTVASDGSLFLGGYVINDSLQKLYSVLVLNPLGKRLWGRTYTGKGEVVRIEQMPDQKIFISGTHWSAKTDTRGYLVWEKQFNKRDSVVASCVLNKNEICYLVVRDSNKLVLFRTGTDNKPLSEKELSLPELQNNINALIRAGSGLIAILMTYPDHQSVNWISVSTGEIKYSSRLPEGIYYNSIISDRNNNLIIEACNHEIIVIKNKGLTL